VLWETAEADLIALRDLDLDFGLRLRRPRTLDVPGELLVQAARVHPGTNAEIIHSVRQKALRDVVCLLVEAGFTPQAKAESRQRPRTVLDEDWDSLTAAEQRVLLPKSHLLRACLVRAARRTKA
jgi:hypothetical protein